MTYAARLLGTAPAHHARRRRASFVAVVGTFVAFTLVASACGSSDDVAAPPDAGYGVLPDAAEAAPDAVVDLPQEGGTCQNPAPTKADLDGSGGWNGPPAPKLACTPEEITAFAANVAAQPNQLVFTKSGVTANLSTACESCLFSQETDARWSAVVADNTEGFLNVGACYAIQSGSVACGQAEQYDAFCRMVVCSCGADFSSCVADPATAAACAPNFGADIDAQCGTSRAALDAACSDPAKLATRLCGTDAADASTDASLDAPAD